MVTERLPEGRRGQIVLVGALSIAFIVIALAVLFNAVTFTGQTTVQPDKTAIDDSTRFDFESRRGIRELILRVNHLQVYGSQSNLSAAVSHNASEYSAVTGAPYSSSGAVVNVSFDGGTSDYGHRIVQAEEQSFAGPGGSTWNVSNDAERVGWFVLSINVTTVPTHAPNSLIITVSNASESLQYRMYSSGGQQLTLEAIPSSGAKETYRFNSTRDHVILDLLNGRSPMNQSANVRSIRWLEGPYDIEFEQGDAIDGAYSIVVSPSVGSFGVSPCTTGAAGPCRAPAVWNASVETRYESATVNVTHEQTIPVYNASS